MPKTAVAPPKATWHAVKCSRCHKEFVAGHGENEGEGPNDEPCIGPPGTAHDLHGISPVEE